MISLAWFTPAITASRMVFVKLTRTRTMPPTAPNQKQACVADLPTPLYFGLIVAIGTLALLVRTIDLGSIPPGLHFDQAANGLLGLEILSSHAHPVFFSSYTGREALFFYLIAGLEAILGPNVIAIRLAG